MSLDATWRTAIAAQYGAALDMLEDAIRACPEPLWGDRTRTPEFWYLAFHTVFWVEYYLADPPGGYAPPAPFTLDELDPAGLMPERVYTKAELLAYLAHSRARLAGVLAGLTEARAAAPCGLPRREMSVGELLLYALRHTQHHAAQLHLLLRQHTNATPGWVSRGRDLAAGA